MAVPAFSIAWMLAGALAPASAPPADRPSLEAEVDAGQVEAIKKRGPSVLPALARLYEAEDTQRKAAVAAVFYQLGWKSADAKRVLMKDAHSQDTTLRLRVQYALGRVSDDPDVVDVLLENMQNDGNLLFRDKAACALAYDQIHLTPAQKVRLFEGLIRALEDPKLDVRAIALLALRIHTGQTKGFSPAAAPEARRKPLEEWWKWLAEYKSQL